MLRNTGHKHTPGVRWQDSIKETDGEIQSKRQNVSGDWYPSLPKT